MTFLRIKSNLEVPMSRVRSARGGSLGLVAVELDSGEVFQTSRSNWIEAKDAETRQYFHAAKGTYLLHYFRDGRNGDVWREAVIGWAVDANGFATPTTYNGVFRSQSLAPTVLHPDGRIQEFDGMFETYDAWLADVQHSGCSRPPSKPHLELVE